MDEVYKVVSVISKESDGFTVLRVKNMQTSEEQVCYLSSDIAVSQSKLYSARELQIL